MTFRTVNGTRPTRTALPGAALSALRAIESHVRLDFRRSVAYGLVALAALITGHDLGGAHVSDARYRIAVYGCATLMMVFAIASSRSAAREVQRVTTARAGASAATPLRFTVLLLGYLIAVVALCNLLDVDIRQFLVGGAITGIVVGLAAQPVLSNLFAGLVLLFARPYVPGQHVRVMSGAINGPHDGVIVSAGVLYTVLETDNGPLNIPNNTLLAAAVGPVPQTDPHELGQAAPAEVAQPAAGPSAPTGPASGSPASAQPAASDGATTAAVLADAEWGDRRHI